MSNITFICEGASEKKLVEYVLIPYWKNKGVSISGNVIILGEENPGCRGAGGDVSFERLKIDLSSAMAADKNDSWFTTIFDFYALHGEWPGQQSVKEGLSSLEKVEKVENTVKGLLASQLESLPAAERFIPFFMLHEYESLLFVKPSAITEVTKARKATADLQKILSDFNSKPEEINTVLSPSQRLARAKANYGKTLHAHRIIQIIGIDPVRAVCPHFNDWMTKLERLD